MSNFTDEEIARDIRRVAAQLGRTRLSRREYQQQGGQFSLYQIDDGGRTWRELCRLARVETKARPAITSDTYLGNLRRAYRELGRLPKASERKKFGLNFSKRRWPNLSSFYRYAAEIDVIPREALAQFDAEPEELALNAITESGSTGTPEERIRSLHRPIPPIPTNTQRRHWARTGLDGFPYAPQDESGVIAVFAILCAAREINWRIVELNAGKGIDARCFDHENDREITVELKYLLSRASWNHTLDEIDAVVCWENRWPNFPKPVIELKQRLARPTLKR